MAIRRLLVLSTAALITSTIAGHAGPCSHEIDSVQALVDAKLDATAGAGAPAKESLGALEHRQPTPGSIAAAESRLGEVSPLKVEVAEAAMARARKADAAEDKGACEQALAEVRAEIARSSHPVQ
jgi:hypothetical protein